MESNLARINQKQGAEPNKQFLSTEKKALA